MRAKLVKIGNSQAVRLPKAMIKRAGLNGSVIIELCGDQLILRKPDPRAGWDAAFRRAVKKHGPPRLTKEDKEWLDAPLTDESDLPPW